jgi:hypothetical protein
LWHFLCCGTPHKYKKEKLFKMTIEFLIEMYRKKDKKRKRALWELFDTTIKLPASLAFIADTINKELQVDNLVSESDIKYCRFYFMDKVKSNIAAKDKPKISNSPKSNTSLSDIDWTDPDEINNPKTVKSKFSK